MPKKVTIDDQGLATPYSLTLSIKAGDTVVWQGPKGWRVKFGARNPFKGNNFLIKDNGETDPVQLRRDPSPHTGGYDYVVEAPGSEGGVDPRIEINP